MTQPLIFDIVRGSFVDGPGIRTAVFLKGCPLSCLWCHNPESQNPQPETMYYHEKCIGCGECKKGCHSMARLNIGKYISAEKLARIILRDKVFYENNSGGVTFTGGEPLLFIDYLYDVSRQLKYENIHIAVETCGYFNFDKFKVKLSSLINLILYDVKIIDPEQHKSYTGKSNELILNNLRKLIDLGIDVLPRIPLIPTFTATEENLSNIAELFRSYNIHKYSFLPYNPSGIDKMIKLNRTLKRNLTQKPMTSDEEQNWIEFFTARMNNLVNSPTNNEVQYGSS